MDTVRTCQFCRSEVPEATSCPNCAGHLFTREPCLDKCKAWVDITALGDQYPKALNVYTGEVREGMRA